MKPQLTKVAACILVTGLSAADPALSTGMSSLPPVKEQGVVSYITGGIGEDEATAFRQAAATYPLELVFAQKARPRDEFLSDVRVTIRHRSGRLLLNTVTDGPFLLAKLPAGNYTITADHDGELKSQSIEIHAGKHQRAVFVWAARTDSGESVRAN